MGQEILRCCLQYDRRGEGGSRWEKVNEGGEKLKIFRTARGVGEEVDAGRIDFADEEIPFSAVCQMQGQNSPINSQIFALDDLELAGDLLWTWEAALTGRGDGINEFLAHFQAIIDRG